MDCLISSAPSSLPHARGGVSKIITGDYDTITSSPRAWGCFWIHGLFSRTKQVFPTRVGVFPYAWDCSGHITSLPHARGGVSTITSIIVCPDKSSPRAWGCFWTPLIRCAKRRVFPTRVGGFLLHAAIRPPRKSLPHARGGVSAVGDAVTQITSSSPRAWGCFYGHFTFKDATRVFPTRVGVFPSQDRLDD